MNTQEIIEGLRVVAHDTWRELYRAAVANRQAVTPGLIEVIWETQRHPERALAQGLDQIPHIHAMYLLAQFGESRALSAIVALCSLPSETIDALLGDFITEDLPSVLASVYGGDLQVICGLIENTANCLWVRTAALDSLIVMVGAGLEPRERVITYLATLCDKLVDKPVDEDIVFWSVWVLSCCYLAADTLWPRIQALAARDLYDPMLIDVEDAHKKVMREWPVALAELQASSTYALVRDAEWQASWLDGVLAESISLTPEERAILGIPLVLDPDQKVGRNDPCPCGSGIKFKYCCGRRA